MRVKVKLYASFRLRHFSEAVQECLPGASVTDLVTAIGIPLHEVGIVLVNGRHATKEELLEEGDQLSLMPLIGGG